MIFVVGGEGFVGQAYVRLARELGRPVKAIGRSNYSQFVGQRCDVLINANGNSRKFMADRDPVWEFDASVVSVARTLADFPADRYVFLSTGDVYPVQHDPSVTLEDQVLDTQRMSRYGLHKSMAEMLVRATHPQALVVRMGGFVGPGMRKQPIWLDPESELQFISTDRAAATVWQLIDRGIVGETVNLGARGTVRIRDIYDRLRPTSTFEIEARRVRFELSIAKLEAMIDAPLPDTTAEIDAFLSSVGR
jgi:nucleoside-diphosphate-sugar epimerase